MARTRVEKNIAYDDEKDLYYVTFDYGKDENGKRHKPTKTFKSKSEAKKALKEFEADKTKGTLVIPKSTTLEEWLTYWINDVITPKSSPTTVNGYQNIIDNHIVPILGITPIQQLSASQIQQYYSKLAKENGLSQSTIRKHHDLLNTALKLAVKQDIIPQNPIQKVEAPKPEDHEIDFYAPEQIRKLIELVKGDRLEIVVYLAAYLGLRREEILGLKWENVNFESRTIYIKEVRTAAGKEIVVKQPKSKYSKRSLYIADDILQVLTRERDTQNDNKSYLGNAYHDFGLVVAHTDGKPYRPNYLSYLFTKFIADNNLPPLTLHGLRHSYHSAPTALGIYD